MVSTMATNEDAVRPTPDEARAALEGAARAERAVRDLPWPRWLHVVNALGMGLLGLSPLAPVDEALRPLVPPLVGGAIAAANVLVGVRLGAPWAVPTSRAFVAAIVLSCVLALVTMVLALVLGAAWPTFLLAASASGAAALAMVLQHRNAR